MRLSFVGKQAKPVWKRTNYYERRTEKNVYHVRPRSYGSATFEMVWRRDERARYPRTSQIDNNIAAVRAAL